MVPQVRKREEDAPGGGAGRWRGKNNVNCKNSFEIINDQESSDIPRDGPVGDETPDPSEDPDQLEMEAEVLLTHAARRRAQITKNRGFIVSLKPRKLAFCKYSR